MYLLPEIWAHNKKLFLINTHFSKTRIPSVLFDAMNCLYNLPVSSKIKITLSIFRNQIWPNHWVIEWWLSNTDVVYTMLPTNEWLKEGMNNLIIWGFKNVLTKCGLTIEWTVVIKLWCFIYYAGLCSRQSRPGHKVSTYPAVLSWRWYKKLNSVLT